jgi:hypothetical protein
LLDGCCVLRPNPSLIGLVLHQERGVQMMSAVLALQQLAVDVAAYDEAFQSQATNGPACSSPSISCDLDEVAEAPYRVI